MYRGRRARRQRQMKHSEDDGEPPCGSLKLENINKRIGDLVAYTYDTGEEGESIWYGFHRSEKPIDSSFQEEVRINAISYTEKGVEFQVDKGKVLSAVLTKKDSLPRGNGLFIQTRNATEEEMERVKHPRHPVQRWKKERITDE